MKQNRKLVFTIAILVCLCGYYLITAAEFVLYTLFFIILYMIVAAIVVFLSGKKLKLNISGDIESNKGETFNLKIRVSNVGRLPAINSVILLHIENLLTGQVTEEELETGFLMNKDREFFIEMLEAHCGCVQVNIKKVKIKDPINLLEVSRDYKSGFMHFVLPKTQGMLLSDDAIEKFDMESFKYSPYKSGDDPTEVFQIRKYMQGDSIKTIHWKLSAKSGTTMIRQPSLPVDNKILLFLDKSATYDMKMMDRYMDLFASLSTALILKGIPHMLCWFDHTEKKIILKKAGNEEELWDAIRYSMTSNFCEETVSGVYRFLESDIEKVWSNYLCISDIDTDIERLRKYGEVSIYRPSDYK